MVFTLADHLFSMVRIWNYNGELCDRRCRRGVEAVDNHREMDSADSEHQNKRRKMQNSLCLKSEQVEKIITWFRNDEITTIGIYGMGGIGKTTLAEQLYAQLLDHITFSDIIAYVSVGMNFTIYQLQEKIAKAFGLDLDGDKDDIRRSGIIYAFLSKNKKCILILDDLWSDFRREDVGIPTKCKLFVISRSLNVCRMLRCQKAIKIEPLSKDESWKLFQHSIGYSASDDPDEVHHMSKLVYDKCAGLTLAITVLTNRMKVNDDASKWKEVLEGEDPFSGGENSQLEDIFCRLKKSYDVLNTKLQRCFLYAALYPKNRAISKEELLRLWMGEGLIDDVRSLQLQYDMGHSILNKLLNTCLLETCQDKRKIKVHDFIRRMALSIVGEKFMVNRDVLPFESDYCKLKGISQINSLISTYPWKNHLKFTNLSILLLQHNPLGKILEPCFKNMCGLRVLSLSHTWITKLPHSISELKELQVLDLRGCKRLENMPLLVKLHKLRILDLSQTAIEQVPRSIEKLKGIMELNLSDIPALKEIPNRVFPALPRLKKLSCLVSGSINQEVQTLETLEILDAKFENLYDFHNYVKSQHWRALECFHLRVGNVIDPERPHTRAVSLQGCSLRFGGTELLLLPFDIQELYLEDCSGFCSMSEIISPANAYGFKQEGEVFASLEICSIRRCQEVEKLFQPDWMHTFQSLELLEVKECAQLKEFINSCCEVKRDVVNFPQLNELILSSLPQLKSIHEGRLVCASLQSLTVIDCPNLKRLPFCIEDIERLVPLTLECIEGQEEWWDALEWDVSRSKDLLQPLLRCISSLNACSLKNEHIPNDTVSP